MAAPTRTLPGASGFPIIARLYRPRRASPSNTHPTATTHAGVLPPGSSAMEADGEAQPRNPRPAPAAAARPHLSGRRIPYRSRSNAPDHHAPDAGSRRSFRPPDPLLEPEDGPLHLRRPRQDPHHQPREDRAAVRRRDELHLRHRAE